ncbi:MAG TPA: hypothetical protein VKT28_17155 [Puia sp.]|nr:hypothetical protein [Puia sp.]
MSPKEWFKEWYGCLINLIIIAGVICYFVFSPKSPSPKPAPPDVYDVRSKDLGKQFIYKNDSVYIVHVYLDSVIKDSVQRDECPCMDEILEKEHEDEPERDY